MGGEERVAGMFLPAISRRERRALSEGSRSMKEVRISVPSSTTVRKEKRRRESKRNVKGVEEKEVAERLRS